MTWKRFNEILKHIESNNEYKPSYVDELIDLIKIARGLFPVKPFKAPAETPKIDNPKIDNSKVNLPPVTVIPPVK